ncbi:hypothetical protein [Xanthomonas graminis]|uniref:hypothetical protein n=1 Tax=Xanthomonas graminis TaxID=3390026 RepID=UPI0011875F19|nr:hypothetical protein [Xanthomonas translucens]UKE78246.1 hypothetical protein KM317_03075 [Xanthomonas translucens pv. arrhenatheri]
MLNIRPKERANHHVLQGSIDQQTVLFGAALVKPEGSKYSPMLCNATHAKEPCSYDDHAMIDINLQLKQLETVLKEFR